MKEQKTTYMLYISLSLLLLLFTSCNGVPKPVVGDVFVVQKDTASFTTWKIAKVESRNVEYVQNDYEVTLKKNIDSINFPENYTDLPYTITYKAFKKKHLKSINPKNNK